MARVWQRRKEGEQMEAPASASAELLWVPSIIKDFLELLQPFLFPRLVEADMTNGKGGGVSTNGETLSPSQTVRNGVSLPGLL